MKVPKLNCAGEPHTLSEAPPWKRQRLENAVTLFESSVRQICEPLGFNKSRLYYQPKQALCEHVLWDETEKLACGLAKCPMRIVFNAVPARSSMLYKAKRAVEVYGVEVSPCLIGDRIVFSHAVIEGLGVMEYEPKGKASLEIQALFRYMREEMEAADGPTT